MKVLQILPELNAGGVERVVMVISDYLVANGHQSIVVSNGGRLVSALEESGARHITLPVHRKSPASFFQVRPMRKILEREKPDILHLHSRVPGWIAWLAWRKMDRQTRPRLVSTVHGFYSVNAYSSIMTRGERVIAVSESIRDFIRTNFPKTPNEAIRLVQHGIDPAAYPRDFQPDAAWIQRWQTDYPHLVGKDLLLLPGRITRLKGHKDFLRLIAMLRKTHPAAHGLIVGDTHPRKRAYMEEVKQTATGLGLAQDVTFVGHRSDLREIMAASRMVCSLSTSPESFGLTALEALALGRPVIGYDHGGVGELLRELFPSGRVPLRDETALLKTTQQILAADSSLSSPRLGGAREICVPAPVKEPFTLAAMCRSTLDVYRELIQSSRTA